MMRGVLISSIFSKTLKLSTNADSESRAMTLMIANVEGVMGSVKHLNEVWASLIETALATWLLERQVGLASLSMIALVLGAFSLLYPNMAT
jgi:ATP-binding cassette subfamily C (CFTR/MRP) protein 1